MSRLSDLIANAKRGLDPWQRLPEARLAGIAAAMGPAEIAELRARLDTLAAELDTLPNWDGDTSDDISAAAATLYGLIARLAPALRPEAEKGLASALPRARIWVALGLEAHGASALPALVAALARETDEVSRQMIAGVVERLGGQR